MLDDIEAMKYGHAFVLFCIPTRIPSFLVYALQVRGAKKHTLSSGLVSPSCLLRFYKFNTIFFFFFCLFKVNAFFFNCVQ